MKKNVLTSVLVLLGAALFAVSFTACSNEPDKPNNEPENKLHEDPTKVTIQLVECHMHGAWNKIETNGGPHQNPESKAKYLKRIQEITYEVKTGKGWGLAEGSQSKFYVIKANEYPLKDDPNPAPIYLMFIKYYNVKGELMNQQFVQNGQDAIHQHFFTVENVKNLMTDAAIGDGVKTTDYIEYKYVDTTPWDKTHHSGAATLTGKSNPIGLKGAVRFLKDRVTMNLRIRLLHDNRGKKDPKTGSFSPFDSPSSRQVQIGSWDINITVPVVVYAENEDYIEGYPTTMTLKEVPDYVKKHPNGSLDKVGNNLIHSIMKAFNISWDEALTDYCTKYITSGDAESGTIWL